MRTLIRNIILITFIVSTAALLTYCVESLVETPGSTPDIAIIRPKSGDTVQVGKNEIKFSASPGLGSQGLSHYEIFLNNEFVERVDQNQNGTNPKLYLIIDSTYINSTISYFINVYNLENKIKTSQVENNIFVEENRNPPDNPLNLRLEIFNDIEILLYWEDSSFNTTSFEVWRREESESDFKIIKLIQAVGSQSYSYSDKDVQQFRIYYYKVRAVNAFGASEFSNIVSNSGGNAPTNLEAQALGATAVLLTWQDNSISENGFKVQRALVAGTFNPIKILPPNTEEYIDQQGLTANTTYKYRVATFTENGEAFSNEAVVITFNIDIPPPADLVAAYNAPESAVIIVWKDNTMLENGTYVERRTGASGSFTEIGSTYADVNTFTDTNIQPEEIYYYRARFKTTEGFFTQYSNIDSAYVPSYPPKKPTNLRILPVTGSNTDFSLIWQDNSNNEDGFELWSKFGSSGTYQKYNSYSQNTIGVQITVQDTTDENFFKVRAFKGNKFSEFSNEVGSKGGIGAFILTIKDVTSASVKLEWIDVFSTEIAFSIERLRLTFPADTNFVVIGEVGSVPGINGIQTYTDIKNIHSLDQFIYRARAIFSQGYSDYSNEVTVIIP